MATKTKLDPTVRTVRALHDLTSWLETHEPHLEEDVARFREWELAIAFATATVEGTIK